MDIKLEEVLGVLVTVIVFILLPSVPDFIPSLVTFIIFVANCIVSASAGLLVASIVNEWKN